MDNQRLILFVALSLVTLLLWEAWQKDYAPPPPPVSEQSVSQPEQTAAQPVPQNDVPSAAPSEVAQASTTLPPVARSSQRIHVLTDVFDIEIDTYGGDIREADLLQYPVSVDQPDQPTRLMQDSGDHLFIAQSGLRTTDSQEPTHHAIFQAEQTRYQLQDGQNELVVPLTWTSPEGVVVVKRYRFTRGDYLIQLEQEVVNGMASDWHGRQYRQLKRRDSTAQDKSMFIHTYTGGVIYSPAEKYEKISFSDMAKQDLSRDITNGWAAVIQHYFLGAWIPDRGEPDHYYSKKLADNQYVLGLVGPTQTVPAGAKATFHSELFVGPKLQHRLEKIAEGLELTVDYGFLTVLAKPVYWLLEKIHGLVGNWGLSIILVTVLIKLLFYKPSEMSYKSMAQMRKLGPRLKTLKERYGDDKQKLNQAMMEMYRTEKINPLGGCLPILIQIPVFISLYWVLLESVELRQAPFALWINDLSTKDPYFVLPVIMGVTMLIQQKLNPAPMDPVQAKVMMVLPLVFTVFFAFFPSGLVLYWVTNNILSITQQWVITRRVEAGK